MKNAIATVTLLGTCGASAQDWPQWRGSNRDARTTGFKVPVTWPKDFTEKWKVTVGTGAGRQPFSRPKGRGP